MRPLILITNDDSINAPGIMHLARCAARFGDVIVAAPEYPHSGQSSALTVNSALRISERQSDSDIRLFAINGTPVDCVKLALNAITPRRPDFIFSGINHGSNSGNAIIYSGTMGAVIEGCTVGIPSVGLSLLSHAMNADFTLSTDYINAIIASIIKNGLPDQVALNINIPAGITPKGMKVCRAARGHWSEEYKRYLDPMGNPFYWLTGRFVNEEAEATDTDEHWLHQGYISVVPVTPDQTAVSAFSDINKVLEL